MNTYEFISENPLLATFLISFGINAFFFTFAIMFKTDKVTDLSYGLSFILIAGLLSLTQNDSSVSTLLILIMVMVWAIRLIAYLFIRILKIKYDKRFDERRNSFVKFGRFWVLQAISVWVIMIPYTLYLSSSQKYGFLTYCGLMVWMIGLILESIADYQKFVFKNNQSNAGKWISSGLWKYSRHPNYFGEMLVWWGIYLFVLPSLSGWMHIAIISPIFISVLLRYVSGIPLLVKSYEFKYGGNYRYREYVKNTRLLIPIPKQNIAS